MTEYSVGERLLLLMAMIVRRVPEKRRIESQLLLEALQADHELVRKNTPHLYFTNWHDYLGQEVEQCLQMELIDDGVKIVKGKRIGPPTHGYIRTEGGSLFLKTLEPRLAGPLEDMPMSSVGVLDFLSLF